MPELGELETSVLDHLWTTCEEDAKAVHAALGARRGITLNTIQSTLKRLFEKGLLDRRKVSHAHLYAPRLSRADFQRTMLEDVIGRVLHGEASTLAMTFVDVAERAGEEHLAELERLISERRRARRRALR